jgi:hypothetical protein
MDLEDVYALYTSRCNEHRFDDLGDVADDTGSTGA